MYIYSRACCSNQCTRGGGGGGGGVIVLLRFAVHELTHFGHHATFLYKLHTYTYDQLMEYFCSHSIIGTLDAHRGS